MFNQSLFIFPLKGSRKTGKIKFFTFEFIGLFFIKNRSELQSCFPEIPARNNLVNFVGCYIFIWNLVKYRFPKERKLRERVVYGLRTVHFFLFSQQIFCSVVANMLFKLFIAVMFIYSNIYSVLLTYSHLIQSYS